MIDRMPTRPGQHEVEGWVAGYERTLIVYVPANAGQGGRRGAVVALHGGGAEAEGMMRFSGLNELADDLGWPVVYPHGTGRNPNHRAWNAGHCCGYAKMRQMDDVAFLEDIADRLIDDFELPERSVHAVGMSNGGMMIYRWAADGATKPGRLASACSVAGPVMMDPSLADRPERHPVPMLHVHGTDDHFVPYEGGPGARSLHRMQFASVDQTLAFWCRHNRCTSDVPPRRSVLHTDDQGFVVRQFHHPAHAGASSASATLIQIQQGGHTWPGREPTYDNLGHWVRDWKLNQHLHRFWNQTMDAAK